MGKLYQVTRNPTYLNAAQKAYSLLPEMGNQHTHGYLNTLRGVALLYEATKDTTHLNFVLHRFGEVLSSKDHLVFGGTSEYFGDQSLRPYYHDEGCSLGDFVMLCIQLWEITGKQAYLDEGEYCLMNQFFHNQFYSGDFGHHQIDTTNGFMVEPSEARAWWCCNYHGITTLSYVADRIISLKNDVIRINLFYHANYHNGKLAFEWHKAPSTTGGHYVLEVRQAAKGKRTIAVRKPEWAEAVRADIDGRGIESAVRDGYLIFDRVWKRGEKLNLSIDYRMTFIRKSDRKEFGLKEIDNSELTAALRYGPYLMSIDDGFQPLYVASPSWDNKILLEEKGFPIKPRGTIKRNYNTEVEEAYLLFHYIHWGMYGRHDVVMRPMSESTFQRPANLRVWFNFIREGR
jgi:DUF1680 family protein